MYELDAKNHDEYKEHLRNSVNTFSTCFTEGLLIDLEIDGQIIGFSPVKIYTNIQTQILLPTDISREIIKIKTNLKVACDLMILYKSTTRKCRLPS